MWLAGEIRYRIVTQARDPHRRAAQRKQCTLLCGTQRGCPCDSKYQCPFRAELKKGDK